MRYLFEKFLNEFRDFQKDFFAKSKQTKYNSCEIHKETLTADKLLSLNFGTLNPAKKVVVVTDTDVYIGVNKDAQISEGFLFDQDKQAFPFVVEDVLIEKLTFIHNSGTPTVQVIVYR